MDSNFQSRTNFQNLENKGFRQETRQFNDTNYQKTYNKNYNQQHYGGNRNNYRSFDEQKDENNNFRYSDRLNSNISYNKMLNKNQNSENESNLSAWGSRYARKTMNWKYIWEEDKKFLEEHLEQISKKKAFDQSFLEATKLKIFFQGREIEDTSTWKSFSDLTLHENLKANLDGMGFDTMTPIQKAVLPFILKGNDTIGCAQTGSGKTVSFLAPIVNKMLIDGPPKTDTQIRQGVSAPVALIIVPTRELAEQIYKEARKIIHKTGIVVVKVYGGIPIDSQFKHIVNGCDILVATPGRLIDFLKRDLIYLNSTKFLVFDEADRMLDMGFEDQLREIVFCSDLPSKEKRINLMFSATFDKNVREIARMFMNDYYFISKAYDQDNTANENIKQQLVYSEENDKVVRLHEILQKIRGSVLIFLDTKKGVDNLSYFLNKRNYNTISIHGDKSQDSRQNAINCFSNGEIPILIATDVASRGLDFPNIPYVINYDLPSNIDDYIHRIGRTGRCGNEGTAISFVNESTRITKDLHKLLKKSNQPIPDWFEELHKKAEYSSFPSYKKSFNSFKNYGQSGSGFTGNKYGYNNGMEFRKGENFRGLEEPGSQPKTFFNSSLNNNSGFNSSSNNYNSTSYSNLNHQVHQSYSANSGFGNSNFNKPYGGGNNRDTRSYYGDEKFSKAKYEY